MSASSTLSGKSNDPTVMTAPCWPAPPAWSAGALLQAQAQHAIASARQATYATVRRSGAALMTFPAVGLVHHVPQSRGPASLRTGCLLANTRPGTSAVRSARRHVLTLRSQSETSNEFQVN